MKEEEEREKRKNEANNDRFEFGQRTKLPKPNRPRAHRARWFFDIYIQKVITTLKS